MSYLQKYVLQKKQKDINVKAFNIITNKIETKAMTEHVLCDCKSKLNSTTYVIQNRNGITKHVKVNVEIIVSARTIFKK